MELETKFPFSVLHSTIKPNCYANSYLADFIVHTFKQQAIPRDFFRSIYQINFQFIIRSFINSKPNKSDTLHATEYSHPPTQMIFG